MEKQQELKIEAVVVTYNRKELLSRCLNALLTQTHSVDKIFIINNASTDGTDEFLKEKGLLKDDKIFLINLEKNVGSAGGFHEGIKRAYEDNADLIWTMDDDGIPDKNCLENLMQIGNLNGKIVNSLVIDIDNNLNLAFGIYNNKNLLTMVKQIKDDIINNWISPYNSTLIHRDVIKKIGLPRPELFIWGDEQEYFFRAKKNEVPMFTVTSSIMRHPRSRDNFDAEIDVKDFWRIYFMIRNLKYYQCQKYPYLLFIFVNFFSFIFYFFKLLTGQKNNVFQKVKIISLAYVHGLRNDFRDIEYVRKICS